MRDLQGFHVVREIVAPGLLTYTTDVACLDELGDEILLFEPGRSGGLPAARLVRVDGTDVEIVAEFEEQADCESPAAIDVPLGSVYFTGALDCRTLYRYDIADDRLEELAQIPKVAEGDAFDAITLSPDGRYLAIGAHPGPRIQTFRIFMLDLSSTPGDYIEAVFRGTYEPAGIHWLGDDRLLVTGTDGSLEGAMLLTPDLEVIETVANVRAGLAGVHDDQIYVLEQSGRLVVMPASGGSARELRQFADPSIRAFVTLDASVTIDPSAPRSDIPVAVAESSSDAGEGDTILPSGSRILGIGLLAMLLGTGSALIYWLTRRRVVRKVAP